MKHFRKFLLSIFTSFFLVLPMTLKAQPYACDPFFFCPGGCQEDRKTCWDIDDPVPLDNGIIILAAAGIIFGLYKLNSRRSIQS